MTPFVCQVVAVHDGDTLACENRTSVRVVGVNAREIHGNPCPRGRPCPPMSAVKARQVLVGLAYRQRLRCTPVGRSYARIVARCTLPDGRSLSCALLASGAAARWDSYWRRYNLPRCQ